MVFVVTIDESKCTGDGVCVDLCPTKVFAIHENGQKKAYVTNPDECLGCTSCVASCENKAITVNEY